MGRHAAAALNIEKDRLAKIGGALLGICGDANHSFGFHLPASELPASDYSRKGKINAPDDMTACCAIDIGMDWKASRDRLRWLITEATAGPPTAAGSICPRRSRPPATTHGKARSTPQTT